MNITGIEVIRRNPGVAAIEVLPGEKIELTYGDTLRVYTSFGYRGPAQRSTLYGAIGKRRAIGPIELYFDEILHNEVSIDLLESRAEFFPCPQSVDILITSDISPGTDYDLYVKIKEYPEAGMPEVDNAIDIVGIPPKFELVEYIIYPQAYVWEGDVEVCTISFSLLAEQVPGTRWLAQKLAHAFADRIKEEGNTVLELKLYEDTTPPLRTKYQAEVTAAVAPKEGGIGIAIVPWLAAALAAIPWKAVWIAVIAIIAILILRWAIVSVVRMVYKAPSLTDEVIEGLEREDLIPMILYKAPRVEYEVSPEELEGMTDDGLRALLKELRDRQAPPLEISPWLILGIVGGLGVLGVGAAVALSAARPRE